METGGAQGRLGRSIRLTLIGQGQLRKRAVSQQTRDTIEPPKAPTTWAAARKAMLARFIIPLTCRAKKQSREPNLAPWLNWNW